MVWMEYDRHFREKYKYHSKVAFEATNFSRFEKTARAKELAFARLPVKPKGFTIYYYNTLATFRELRNSMGLVVIQAVK